MGDPERRSREMCVTLGVRFPARSSQELEDHALTIQEVVDKRAAGIALGAAVACRSNPPLAAVEIIFTVQAGSAAEIYHRVALVIGVIEAALPFALDTVTATTSSDGWQSPDDRTNR
jgi:hypothetical protein